MGTLIPTRHLMSSRQPSGMLLTWAPGRSGEVGPTVELERVVLGRMSFYGDNRSFILAKLPDGQFVQVYGPDLDKAQTKALRKRLDAWKRPAVTSRECPQATVWEDDPRG
jgi:hypothetical protein